MDYDSINHDDDLEARIRERAYLLWEGDGKPYGRDVEFWQRARREVTVNAKPAAHENVMAAQVSHPAAPPRQPGEPNAPPTGRRPQRKVAAPAKRPKTP